MGDALAEARRKMIEKRFGGNAKGASIGSGAARRKAKTASKTAGDDKKLTSAMKKMNLQPINGIDEVNMFLRNDDVIHITQPKIQASIPSNTFIVSGRVETKNVLTLMPGIINQLSQEQLTQMAQLYAKQGAAVAPAQASIPEETEEDEDDEIPELVENFDDAAAK